MRRSKSFKVLSVVFLLVSFFGLGVSLFPETQVKITNPEGDGIQVGKEMTVRGTASIPSGTHLWVLAHKIEGFEDVWWPQSEAKIDPVTNEWSVLVVFGEPRDIGSDFGIAAIVVNKKEHVKLRNYRENAMRIRVWNPIPMPPTVAAPVFKTVNKVSHR